MTPISLFLAGLGCGAVWLWIGLHIGMKLARRGESSSLETQHVRQWLGELSQWTTTFHREVANYREEMEDLTERANDISLTTEPSRQAVVLPLLTQIVTANQRLQRRLDEAESRLQRQSQELQEYLSEARTDGLTDLPNRRALDEEMVRRLAEWRRYRAPFSVALLDIDRFKEINDRFGHVAGDHVLRAVSAALREAMRDADLVSRFGGEEFAIVLPATCGAATFRAAERAREAIERLVIDWEGAEIRPTVSCGATQARENDDASAMLQRADAALYSSKYAGRNRSHWHDGHRCVPIDKATQELELVPAAECVSA